LLAAWRPSHEQGYAVEHPDGLVAHLAVGFAHILAGEHVAVEEAVEIGQVDAVILQVLLALGFIPSVQAGIVDALCICDKPDVFDFITKAIDLGGLRAYDSLQLAGWKLLSSTYKRTVEIPENVVLFPKRTVH